MWLARDKNGDIYLYIYKPIKYTGEKKCCNWWVSSKDGCTQSFVKIHDPGLYQLSWDDKEPKWIRFIRFEPEVYDINEWIEFLAFYADYVAGKR